MRGWDGRGWRLLRRVGGERAQALVAECCEGKILCGCLGF